MLRIAVIVLLLAPCSLFSQTNSVLQLDELLNYYGKYFLRIGNRAELSNGDRLMTFIPANNLDITDGTPDDTTTYPPPFTPSEAHQLHVLYDAQFNIKARLWTIGNISVINDTIYCLQRIEVGDSIDIDPNGTPTFISTNDYPLLATRYNQNLELISYRQLNTDGWWPYWKYNDNLNAFVACYQQGYPNREVHVLQLDKSFATLDSHYVGVSTASNNYPPDLRNFFDAVGGGYYALYGVNGVGGNYNFDLSGNTTTGTNVTYQKAILVRYDAALNPLWITQIKDEYSNFFRVYTATVRQTDQGRLFVSTYNTDDTHYFTYSNGVDSLSIPSATEGGTIIYEIDVTTGQMIMGTRSHSFIIGDRITTNTTTDGFSRLIRTKYSSPTDTVFFDFFQKTNPIPDNEIGVVVYSDFLNGTVDTYFSLPTTAGRDSLYIWAARQRPDGRIELILNSVAQSLQPDPNFPKNIVEYSGLDTKAYSVWTSNQLVTRQTETTTMIDLLVYPNPTTDVFHIDTRAGLEQVQLVDMQGKVLLRQNGASREVDVRSVPQGMYILQMQMKNGVEASKRVLVVH